MEIFDKNCKFMTWKSEVYGIFDISLCLQPKSLFLMGNSDNEIVLELFKKKKKKKKSTLKNSMMWLDCNSFLELFF